MTRFSEVRTVPTDLAKVAGVVLDWTSDPAWRPAVTEISTDPSGRATEGQQIVEHLRFAGSTFVTPTRITSATPTSATFAGGTSTLQVSGERRLRSVADGTEIQIDVEIRFTGWMTPLTRLLAPSYRRRHRDDMDRLAALLSRQPMRSS